MVISLQVQFPNTCYRLSSRVFVRNCSKANVTEYLFMIMPIFVQEKAWCRPARSHSLSQCWSRSCWPYVAFTPQWVNTLRPRQDGCHFPDDTFKWIFLNENVSISIKISLKFVPNGPIDKSPALVQIIAWCRPGDKPLSVPMMVNLLTHICVTRPQWVKCFLLVSCTCKCSLLDL